MGKDNPKLETTYSILTDDVLGQFCRDFFIPADYHPEVPGANLSIKDFPEGKVGVYTRFFEFCNYRVPMSLLLSDLLGYYNIHISQLSVLGAAKASHFEIRCRVHNITPTVYLFRVFYVPNLADGWMSFVKRRGRNVPQVYSKRLESVKDWKDRFFWIDERYLGFPVAWHVEQPSEYYTAIPDASTYSQKDVETLSNRRMKIQRQPELLLCMVGLSRNYTLGDDLYPTFSYNDREMSIAEVIAMDDPMTVRTGSRARTAQEVPLLTLTANRVVQEPEESLRYFGNGRFMSEINKMTQ